MLQVERCIAELKERDNKLHEAAEVNKRLKASEKTALSDLEEARRRLRSAESELDSARNDSVSNVGEANDAYNNMVRQANERLKKRDETIDRLTSRLNATMDELSSLQSQLSKLQREKTELLSSRHSTPSYSPVAASIRPSTATPMASARKSYLSRGQDSSSEDEGLFQSGPRTTSLKSLMEDKTLEGSDSSDDDKDGGPVRDLWGRIPDMLVGARSPSQGSSFSSEVMRRRMRAKSRSPASSSKGQL